MGEVFLARRQGASGVVVIKRVLPRLATQEAFLDRFLHEARVVARLNDPTIVRIVELGDVEGQWFLAMEYVDGVDVQTLLGRARLPVGAACRIALEGATGLSVAHGARDSAGRATPVIHRDVSPHNLLVSAGGEVKLIDFGVAALGGQGESGGKLAYAAPEQLLEDVTDARGDQYSLGVVLWEGLAGRPCFDAEDDVEVIRLVTEVGPPPLPAGVAGGLRAVVERMTALDPAARFESVAAARAALAGEVKALKLDVSAAALAALVPSRSQRSPQPAADREPTKVIALDETERAALAVLKSGMTAEEAEAAIDGAALAGAPFALDVLQALVEKGALVADDAGGERRFFPSP